MKELIPFLIIGGLVLIFALTYVLNKKTPIPEGCLTKIDEIACNSCHNNTCSHHK